jgi:hypothetical protein
VYDSLGWTAIAAAPTITEVSPSTFNGESGTSFTVTGANFDSGVTVKFIDSGGNEYTAGSVTRTSSSSLTITTPQDFTVADEPLSVKVTNTTGLSYVLESAIDCGGVPAWVTSSGSLGQIVEDEAMSNITLSATDPEGGQVTYQITSGALPAGVSLNSSTGVISGTPNVNDAYSTSVTHNFTVSASDGVNQTARAFSILRKWRDGSSSTLFAESAAAIKNINPSATNGFYWIRQTGSTSFQHYCVFTDYSGAGIAGGPWTVPLVFNRSSAEWNSTPASFRTQFMNLMASVGINTPGRGMENSRSQSEVYGAWLAVKRTFWEAHPSFVSGKSSGGGGVMIMPMCNNNGPANNPSDHRLVYNAGATHLPTNRDGDRADAGQYFAGWWGANDVASWTTNDNEIPGPEDWSPGDSTNSTYGYSGFSPLVVCGVYK